MDGRLGILGAVAAALLAGCVASPAELAPAQAPEPDQAAPDAPFELALHGCIEGGGHSVYNADYVVFDGFSFAPPEWEPADVREDVGNPLRASTQEPLLGPAHGYYHATVTCEHYTFLGEARQGWVSGHVGIRVEPPRWDPGGADRHYLVSTLPFADPEVREALAARGYHATHGTGLVEPRPWHSVLEDELNGTYTSWNDMEERGPAPDHVVRVWQLVPEGEKWRPVFLDMATRGATHLAAPGGGHFTHQHHGDPEPRDPGPLRPLSNAAGLAWSGFDRVVTPGAPLDVLLDHAFVHH